MTVDYSCEFIICENRIEYKLWLGKICQVQTSRTWYNQNEEFSAIMAALRQNELSI